MKISLSSLHLFLLVVLAQHLVQTETAELGDSSHMLL